MSIQRFLEKPKTVQFEDLTIGVRQPNTGEMLKITKARQAYLKTVKEDPYGDGEGEIEMFLELQKSASKILACDPDDSTNPWFATDKEEQDQLGKSGVWKDLVDQVPHKFHAAVWATLVRPDGPAPLEMAETEMTNETTDSAITSTSTPSSSASESTSDAPSETSNDGIGDNSSTEFNA